MAANRDGRLAPSQRARIAGEHRRSLLTILGSGLVFLAITVMVLATGGASWNPADSSGWMDLPFLGSHPRLGVAVVVASLFLALTPFFWRAFRLWRDLRAGEVQFDEGTIEKHHGEENMSDYSYETWDLYVCGNRYRVPSHVYDAAPADGAVRVYVLPRSRTVVNLERLAPEVSPVDSGMEIG